MGSDQRLPFVVGQLAEAKSFVRGFRGAWFRCKIKGIKRKNGDLKYLMEYYDFPDEKDKWFSVYQVPPWTKKGPKELMVRPQYPSFFHCSRLPAVDLMPEVIVVADGTWKVGDSVDWNKDDCYWSGKVTGILGPAKAEIEFPPQPVGEGSVYEVPFENLRPSLEWSPENGWLVPISTDSESSPPSAWLIHRQANKASVEQLSPQMPTPDQRAANSPAQTCSSAEDIMMDAGSQKSLSFTSPTTSSDDLMSEKLEIMKESFGQASCLQSNLNSVSENKCAAEVVLSNSDPVSRLGDGISDFAAQTCGKGVDGPDFSRKKFKKSESIPLNSMRSNTIEAAIVDLEELANKIRWLKSILRADDTSNSARPVWKFIEPHASSTPK